LRAKGQRRLAQGLQGFFWYLDIHFHHVVSIFQGVSEDSTHCSRGGAALPFANWLPEVAWSLNKQVDRPPPVQKREETRKPPAFLRCLKSCLDRFEIAAAVG